MKVLIVLPAFILVLGGFRYNTTAKTGTKNQCVSDSLDNTILVINSFDAMSIKARNNKKDLFRELTDSLTGYLSIAIKEQTGYKSVVIPALLNKTSGLDSLIFTLMKENNAGKAILVWSLDTHFNESGNREETGDDGKPRTIISYDLCARNEYTLYSKDKILKQSTTENCEFFTTRSVKGRFVLNFGPDIVGKKKYTYKIVANNASKYISEISTQLKDQ
jgi:hypothetical protein